MEKIVQDSSCSQSRGTRERQKTSLATKKVGDFDGMVPSPKVQQPINPAKVQSREIVKNFKKKNPLLSTKDYVSKYKGISDVVVEKVKEGFKCLVEIFHLYGLDRPRVFESISDFKGANVEAYFDKYADAIISNHKYHLRIQGSITKMLCYLNETKDESLWVSYFKYKTCAFFAFHEGQEIPPAPLGLVDKPGIIFFPEWVNSFKRKDAKKGRKMWLSFLMSMNQAKMGMPRDLKSSIEKAEKKCALHLTTEPPPLVDRIIMNRRPIVGDRSLLTPEDLDFHELDRIVVNKETMCRQLRRTCREMFQNSFYKEDLHYEPFFPSTSSNYNRTRGMMGAVGEIINFIRNDPELDAFFEKELLELKIQPVRFREELSRRYGDAGKYEQETFDKNAEHEESGISLTYSDVDFKILWRKLMDRLFEAAYIEDPRVEPLGLLEALKIRVISKGPPLLYTLLKPLQKFLWAELKKQQAFTLIGTPITVDLIDKVIGRMSEDQIVINGDYKASTDNLHSWVSECLANELVDILNENAVNNPNENCFFIDIRLREMLLRSLIHHKFEIDGQWKDQKEGQLMGSITSFPFLCLANACFCRWALELADKREYRLTNRPGGGPRAPLLINGDDCTLRGDRRFLRDNWEKITSFGGLTSSVGKTFYSLPQRPICMINSVAFDYNFETLHWEERKYVNMGILLGQKRSIGAAGNQNNSVSYGAMGELHRELYRQSPPEIWTSVSSRFIYFNANVLKQYPNIPWDMPEYLGGPGLVPSKPYSELDLRCATLLKMNMREGGGFHKPRLAVRKVLPSVEWKLHELVRQRLAPFESDVGGTSNFRTLRNLNGYEYGVKNLEEVDLYSDFIADMNELCPFENLEENYSRLYKYIVVETLFRNYPSDLHDIHAALPPRMQRILDKGKFTMDKDGNTTFRSKLLTMLCYSDEQVVEEYTRKGNNLAWRNVIRDAYNVQSMVPLQQHEVAHEKKDFVIPVSSFSLYGDIRSTVDEFIAAGMMV